MGCARLCCPSPIRLWGRGDGAVGGAVVVDVSRWVGGLGSGSPRAGGRQRGQRAWWEHPLPPTWG